jgi:hypothetical protein
MLGAGPTCYGAPFAPATPLPGGRWGYPLPLPSALAAELRQNSRSVMQQCVCCLNRLRISQILHLASKMPKQLMSAWSTSTVSSTSWRITMRDHLRIHDPLSQSLLSFDLCCSPVSLMRHFSGPLPTCRWPFRKRMGKSSPTLPCRQIFPCVPFPTVFVRCV